MALLIVCIPLAVVLIAATRAQIKQRIETGQPHHVIQAQQAADRIARLDREQADAEAQIKAKGKRYLDGKEQRK